jgi:predicted transposase YbfD/YdcC
MSKQQSPLLFDHFDKLKDPRVDRTKAHPLLNVIFIGLCAVVSGANDFVGMEKFGKSKRAWLEKYVELPNGIPTHDTFGRVFEALDPHEFLTSFLSWVEALQVALAGKLVNIDGKTARATLDKAKGKNPLHVVSAWAAENRLLLGQVCVDEKSNEITAIPKLLEVLELSGAIITIDAMGCQKEIVTKIREKGADYVLAVKGNQEFLEEDVIACFAALDAGTSRRRPSVCESVDKGHGRKERRRCEALSVPQTLRNLEVWQDLHSICRVTRTYTENGEEKSEVRYFISSLPASAAQLAQAIRGHWGVENGLHWVLDMYFGEDKSRARAGNAAANMALLRRWVLSWLRQDKTTTGSIEKKRLQAGWVDKVREDILGLF